MQRIAIGIVALGVALAACASTATSSQHVISSASPATQATFRPCSQMTFSVRGVKYQIQFARNGAVQRYVLSGDTQNEESNHDALQALQRRFGPEGVNTPPLRIVAYKNGAGGMRIPTKTVDSCGRITSMQ